MTCSNAGDKSCPIWGDYLSNLKSRVWVWKVPATLLSPSEPTAFRYPLWRQHCPHPPREARFSRHTAMAGGSHSLWTVTFGSAVLCIIYTRAKWNAFQWTGTQGSRFKSPSRGFFSLEMFSANISRTSVYLCLLFWLKFTSFCPLLPASVLSDFVPSLPTCSLNFYLRPCLSYRGNAALLWWSLWELIFK